MMQNLKAIDEQFYRDFKTEIETYTQLELEAYFRALLREGGEFAGYGFPSVLSAQDIAAYAIACRVQS